MQFAICNAFLSSYAQAADTGEISGRVSGSPRLTSAAAVDRAAGKKFPGKIVPDDGAFTISRLPLGARYDLVLDAGPTVKLEGVDLAVPASDYEEEQPLTEEDAATITEKIRGMNVFEDKVEVLAVKGNIQHAAIVLNKVRTQPFYGSKPGEVVWRPELWHFQRPEDTWLKSTDELFIVLYRERLQKKDLDARSVTFDATLGGLVPTKDTPKIDLGEIKLSERKPGVRIRGVEQ